MAYLGMERESVGRCSVPRVSPFDDEMDSIIQSVVSEITDETNQAMGEWNTSCKCL